MNVLFCPFRSCRQHFSQMIKAVIPCICVCLGLGEIFVGEWVLCFTNCEASVTNVTYFMEHRLTGAKTYYFGSFVLPQK